LEKHQLRIIGSPKISDVKLQRGQKMTFCAEFETMPQIKLKNYKGIKLSGAIKAVTADDIAKTINSLRESRAVLATVEESRPVKWDDHVLCEVKFTDKDTQNKPIPNAVIPIERGKGYDVIAEELVGVCVGQNKIIEMPNKESDSEKQQAGSKTTYDITVKEIKVKKLPSLDENFAKSFGKENIAQLEEEVRKDIERFREHEENERLKEEICKFLLKTNKISLPPNVVEQQKKHLEQYYRDKLKTAQAKAPEEREIQIQKESEDRAKDQIKLYFIIEQIAEEEKIDVSEEELAQAVRDYASYAQQSEEEIVNQKSDDIRQRIRQDKVLKFLLDSAILNKEGKR